MIEKKVTICIRISESLINKIRSKYVKRYGDLSRIFEESVQAYLEKMEGGGGGLYNVISIPPSSQNVVNNNDNNNISKHKEEIEIEAILNSLSGICGTSIEKGAIIPKKLLKMAIINALGIKDKHCIKSRILLLQAKGIVKENSLYTYEVIFNNGKLQTNYIR